MVDVPFVSTPSIQFVKRNTIGVVIPKEVWGMLIKTWRKNLFLKRVLSVLNQLL